MSRVLLLSFLLLAFQLFLFYQRSSSTFHSFSFKVSLEEVTATLTDGTSTIKPGASSSASSSTTLGEYLAAGSSEPEPAATSVVPADTYSPLFTHPVSFKLTINALTVPNITCDNSTKLVVAVTSEISETELRQTIRETWGRKLLEEPENKLFFVIGRSLDGSPSSVASEARAHGDILEADFTDTYYNLSLKTMVLFKWIGSECPQARMFMKVDSDTFLFPQNLLRFVDLVNQRGKTAIYGHCWSMVPVIRDRGNKWFVSRSQFKEERFPRYCSGHAYLMPTRLVEPILEDLSWRTYFPTEDVLFTGLTADRLKVPRVSINGLTQEGFRTIHKCEKNLLAFHKVKRRQHALDTWKAFLRSLSRCTN